MRRRSKATRRANGGPDGPLGGSVPGREAGWRRVIDGAEGDLPRSKLVRD